MRPDYNRPRALQGRPPEKKIIYKGIIKKKLLLKKLTRSQTVRNSNGRMICVAVIHGCGIGYKYYARYTDCQRKNEILQCSLNN